MLEISVKISVVNVVEMLCDTSTVWKVRVTLEISVVRCVVKNVEVLPKTSVVSKVSVKLKTFVE